MTRFSQSVLPRLATECRTASVDSREEVVNAGSRNLHWLRACALAIGALAAMPLAPAPGQNPIVLENLNPGVDPSIWYVAGPGNPNIQGFATDMSVNRGETVRFKIDTDSPAYHIDIYRLGWYQGLGARLVGTGVVTATLPQLQPAPLYDAPTAMTDCGNWAESAHWDVPSSAVSGVHVAKLTRDDATAGTSHVVFVVRDDSSTSDLLVQTSDTTWQAYNLYGGASLYPAGGSAPGFNHAVKVSYNRPFDIRNSSGGSGYDFFAAEYAMVRWLEANGYDATYFAGVDADRRGVVIQQHRVYLSVGHDEYWSGPQRANVTAARDAGVHLAFFSGDEVYWKTRFEPSIDGSNTPHRTLVCYKEGSLGENGCGFKCDPSPEWTGLWRDGCAPYDPITNGACRPENSLTGQIGWDGTIGAIQVPDSFKDLRFWRFTSVASLLPGQTATLASNSLGHEWDPKQYEAFYPPRRILLSTTVLNARTHHLSLYRADSGALVFGAGTVQWSWGLDDFHTYTAVPTNVDMQQATVNLFADMGVSPGSLQPGLVPASASSDTQPPASIISAPASGSTWPINGVVAIQGIAADTGGGVVAGVEVSVDGGATWRAATGTTTWSFTWTPLAIGPATIKSRAFDDTGNLEAAGSSGSPNVVAITLTSPSCPCTVFPVGEIPPGPLFNDATPIELGMKFRTDVGGAITALRYYKPAGATGTHTGNLWTANGLLLAQQVFTNETPSGWQEVALAPPVPVTAGTTYVVSYFSASGDYVATQNYFTQQVGAGLVHGLADGQDGPNGLFLYGAASAFPTQSFRSSNYYADVVFDTVGDVTPPTVTANAPAAGATGVPANAAVTATFSEALDPTTVSSATFELRDAAGAIVPAVVSYVAATRTAVLTPMAPLAQQSTYSATVRGGTTDPRIKDPAGNALAQDHTWSFTTAAPTAGPFAVFAPGEAPAAPRSNDGTPIELGMKFRADVDGFVAALRYYKPVGTTGTHTGNLWTANGTNLAQQVFANETPAGWQEVALTPPVPITAGTTYVVSYFSASGDYVSTAGYFTAEVGNNLVRGLADGFDGPNGLFLYTPVSALPMQGFNASNYWADVVFYAAVPDVTPPTVTAQSPGPGATGVAMNATVTATFSEVLDPSTVTSATFELRFASGTPVPASVVFDRGANTARLTPASPLAPLATFTATLRGGASAPRIRDAAGNALAGDVSWSFTTADLLACPCSVFPASEIPASPLSNDLAPIEVGMRFRADVDAVVTALRYYKPAGAAGTHTGNLWAATGTLLAQQEFANETASGWQEVMLTAPVPISAGTTYVVSYFSASGDYVSTLDYFTQQAGVGLVHGLADGFDGPNGLFLYTPAPAFPTGTYRSSNYYADVVLYRPGQARTEYYGAGCAGTGGRVPVLAAIGLPPLPTQPNATLGLSITNARPVSIAVFAVGLGPLQTAPCSLLIANIGATWGVVTTVAGGATVPLPVPPAPPLVGLALWVQGAVYDPNALTSFVPGLALTQGMRLTLGS
jgi:hypothetical protein